MKLSNAFWWRSLATLVPLASGAESTLDEVEVVASSPLGEIAAASAASNAQVIDGDELRKQRALDLTELMNRNLASVFVNEAQSNPLQPDIMYRGFVGSPLLGLPQGIAVYQDGVRVNEPFGDTVNWVLVPNTAIDSLQLLPGSDPLFGLNALGGSIVLRSKSGFTHQGSRAELSAGSFGRRSVEAETGAMPNDNVGAYASVSYLEEDGWRDYSGTRALQAHGSLGWHAGGTKVDGKLSFADAKLTGNGAVPVQLLRQHRPAVFTHPDDTENSMLLLNVIGSQEFSDAFSMTANAYVRRSDIDTLNGDDSDYAACVDDASILCGDDGPVLDQDGQAVPADDALQGATLNRTSTRQDGRGLGLQLDWQGAVGGRDNRFLAGLAWDSSDIEFEASSELGTLDGTRGALAGGVFVGDADTLLSTDTRTTGLFFSDHLEIGERLQLGVSGRWNVTSVRLKDRLGTALNGDHDYSRFNPSVGMTYRFPAAQFYARYSESNRVPSPVELTCADEDDPCRLPNAFLSDPPLEMVVARTWEGGLRGGDEKLGWHAGVFQSLNDDDIIFVSAGALTNEGFFDNVGRTRRRGIELNVDGWLGDDWRWFVNYSYLQATFRDGFTVSSPNNPAAVNGEIVVRRGDRLPLLPGQLFKTGITWTPSERVLLGLDLQASSEQFLRGDEGNDVGTIPGYAVLNGYGRIAVNDSLSLLLSVKNLFDTDYETFGVFGEPDDVLGDDYDDSRFLSPGAPRGAWFGIELLLP